MRPGSLPWRVRYRLRYGLTRKTRDRRFWAFCHTVWPQDCPDTFEGVLLRMVQENPHLRREFVEALFQGIVTNKKIGKETHARH